MNTYSTFVRTDVGAFTRVTIQADKPYNAFKLLKMLFGAISSLNQRAVHNPPNENIRVTLRLMHSQDGGIDGTSQGWRSAH